MVRAIILFLNGLLMCHVAMAAIQVSKVGLFGSTPTESILEVTLDGATQPRVFKLAQPNRLVIDLSNTHLNKNIMAHQQLQPYALRIGQYDATTVRLVIENAQDMTYQVSPIWKEGADYKLKVSLHAVNGTQFVPPKPQPAMLAKMVTPAWTKPTHPIPNWGWHKRKIVVVIDPGHGGKDPGAFGYHRTPEKDVVLAIAKRLKRKIDSQPNMRAVLTRDGDYFIDLRRRLDISRRYHPDLFVAIHADAFTNSQSHGASVFALSQTGATSEAARWLAEKENYSELAGVNLKELDDSNGMVRSVLIDLSQTATITASLKMGQNVLRNLGAMTSLHNQKVEQARFVVLKSPDTPSILVETGFISNPVEEQRLASSQYQEQLSQAIYNGIYQYFKEYPPRGAMVR
jgi:N-acetylmuramoyl-L-alanine amidase